MQNQNHKYLHFYTQVFLFEIYNAKKLDVLQKFCLNLQLIQ